MTNGVRESDRSKLTWRVGMSVILAAVGLGVILFLTGNYHLTEDGYRLYIMFHYARGIEVGAPVLVSGVKLGAVEDVDFVTEENQSRVRLNLWILKKALVKKDAKIYIKSLGLLGQSAIEITAGSAAADPVSPDDVLTGEEPFVTEAVLAQAQEVAEGLSKAVGLVNSILEEAGGKQKIRATIENWTVASAEFERAVKENAARLDAITKSLEKSSANIEGVTEKGSKDLEATLADLRSSSAELKAVLQTGRPKADEILNNMAEASAALQKASKDIRAATEKMNSAKSAAGVIFSDTMAARNVRNILKNFDEFSEDIREHPWKLIRKP